MNKILLFLLIFLMRTPPLVALTPPLSQQELTSLADIIVEGEVLTPVECVGLTKSYPCYDSIGFISPLKVLKVQKGNVKIKDILKIRFENYDYSKDKCVGDMEALFKTGDRGTYYLKKGSDDTWHQVHWSGVQLTKESNSPLPPCPVKK